MAIILECTRESILEAVSRLKAGQLVVFPTETVYGLGADATNASAVSRIYEVKGRPPTHPLIIHISTIENLDKWAREIPEYALLLAHRYWPGPMTLILPRSKIANNYITGAQDNVGIRIPGNSFSLEFLKEFELQGGLGIAAPSANRFGKVSSTCAKDAQLALGNYLKPNDLILDGGAAIVGIESTIIACIDNAPKILRSGSITEEMINETIGLNLDVKSLDRTQGIRAPGLLDSHYAPNAELYISGSPEPGDGFIALSNIQTPIGAIRLASPDNNNDYARILYSALHLADSKSISKVFAVPPIGDDIAVAICDRLLKASKR